MVFCLLATSGCPEDEAQSADSGPGKQDTRVDGKPGKQDGRVDGQGKQDKGKPDGPKKPARWVDVQAGGPAAWSCRATLLKDGRVLVSGGYIKDPGVRAIKSSWLYRPGSNNFAPTAAMNGSRANHRSVRLNDGRVLVVGGGETSYKTLATAELYDPNKATWQKAQDMSTKRTSFQMLKVKSGNVLVLGGVTSYDPVDSMTIYNVSSNTWILPAAKMKHKRSAFSATVLPNGKVIIIGGFGGLEVGANKSDWLTSIEIFDPTLGSVEMSKAKLGAKRAGHTASLLTDGRILVVGGYCGSSCTLTGDEIYDPSKDSVTSINGPAPHAHEAARLQDGRVLAVGGAKPNEGRAMIFTLNSGGAWIQAPMLKRGRHYHQATALSDGSVLVVGGKGGYPGSYEPNITVAERFYP